MACKRICGVELRDGGNGTTRGEVADGAFGPLPDEMVRAVLSWLRGADLGRASCASIRLRGLADDPALWEALCRASLRAPDVCPIDDRDVGKGDALWLNAFTADTMTVVDHHRQSISVAPMGETATAPTPAATMPVDAPPPPLPELPPSTLLSADPTRKPWRWLYAACHRRVACASSRPLGGPTWWTRWRPWQAARRPGHVIHVERNDGACLVVVEVGDLDDQGRLAGFGLRATCARPSDGVPWRWVEWAWGTWSGGRIEGSGRVCASSGAAHMGRFAAGVAHGHGTRTMPAQCRHVDPVTEAGGGLDRQRVRRHIVEVSGCWRSGKAHGRFLQTTSCGDVWVSLWHRGALTGIESLLLPSRPASRDRPAFGGVRIEGVSWRVEDVASVVRGTAVAKGLFGRCVIAVPAELRALDLYLDYVRAGHPCLCADMAAAVVGAGTRFRATLSAHAGSG